jgi:hypothetical protein
LGTGNLRFEVIMAKLTFQIDEITVEYEFPKTAPVKEFVHAFNRRVGSPDTPEDNQMRECLYWLANQLYSEAKNNFIEDERQKTIVEAEQRYEFRRPAGREDADAAEPGVLAGSTGGSTEPNAPRTRAGGHGTATD